MAGVHPEMTPLTDTAGGVSPYYYNDSPKVIFEAVPSTVVSGTVLGVLIFSWPIPHLVRSLFWREFISHSDDLEELCILDSR